MPNSKKLLSSHYGKSKSTVIERFNFYKRDQHEGETVKEYILELKKLSSTCEFGTFLKEALRDKLVCGVHNSSIQKRLLAEDSKLEFDKACSIAEAMETAISQSDEMNKMASSPVNAVERASKFKQTEQTWKSNMSNSNSCKRCGTRHPFGQCKAINWTCFLCNRKGHIARMCISNGTNTQSRNVKAIDESPSSCECACEHNKNEKNVAIISTVKGSSELMIDVCVNDIDVPTQIDSGACITVMSEMAKNKYFPNEKLWPCSHVLKSVNGDLLHVLGKMVCEVKYHNKVHRLCIVCFKTNKQIQILMGRSWLDVLIPQWRSFFTTLFRSTDLPVYAINNNSKTDFAAELKKKFPNVFKDDGTPISDFYVNIEMKSNAVPVFRKAYSVAYAIKPKVEEELKEMCKRGIIESIDHSEHASPIVPIQKTNGEYRICGDFKNTINKYVEVSGYPLPNSEDIFASITGGKVFCKIDLKGAYQQLQIGAESRKYLTINTHLGLFQYLRMPFGVAAASAYFQQVIDSILRKLDGVVCYSDDILVTGENEAQCMKRCERVFERLAKYNVKVNGEKCVFLTNSIDYLGMQVNGQGIHPTKDKVIAIQNAPTPNNIQQVQSFLGLINFYHRFLPMISSQLKPLYDLLQKGAKFVWTSECQIAFERGKQMIKESNVLVPFDSSKQCTIMCDASPYGIGCVLMIKIDGVDRPVSFASRKLNTTQQNYSQLEKEAMAIVYAVTKFHKYIYGRSFKLITDNLPIQLIMGPRKNIPKLAAGRLQRWAIILSAYNYELIHQAAKKVAVADALSRFPVNVEEDSEIESEIAMIFEENETSDIHGINEVQLNHHDIEREMSNDTVLSEIMECIKSGWPKYKNNDPELKPFFNRKIELSIEKGCILWGTRVVIPEKYRQKVLSIIHEQHIGIVRMKMLARGICWWPNIDADIDSFCRQCIQCQGNHKRETQITTTWPQSTDIWQRVHLDFFHKFGHEFLIVVDSYSKWIDIKLMQNTTACNVITELREIFSTFGTPIEIVSDNGPPFASREFVNFLKELNINILKSPPYHPHSNGLAERAVQTAKNALCKQTQMTGMSKCTIRKKISEFLFKYRNTPCTVTGLTPAEIMLKKIPRTRLSSLNPIPNEERKMIHHHKPAKEENQKPPDRKQFIDGESIWI